MLAVCVASLALASPTSFRRATDLLPLPSGRTVSPLAVANVLGRWQSWREWDGIGELEAMDQLFTPDGREIAPLKAQQSSGLLAAKKGNGDWVAKTPERRSFCIRQGLVQRYWFSENVGRLPFRSKVLAASVGSSVGELNRQPLNPLAVDVVFDFIDFFI